MLDTAESDSVVDRTLRSQTLSNAGYRGVRLVVCWTLWSQTLCIGRTSRSQTLWYAGHCGVRLCGMLDTAESDSVVGRTLGSQTLRIGRTSRSQTLW